MLKFVHFCNGLIWAVAAETPCHAHQHTLHAVTNSSRVNIQANPSAVHPPMPHIGTGASPAYLDIHWSHKQRVLRRQRGIRSTSGTTQTAACGVRVGEFS
jgi:hypothetical protein